VNKQVLDEKSYSPLQEHTSFQQGNIAFRCKAYDLAEAAYAESVLAHPEFRAAWIGRLQCLMKLNRCGDALSLIEKYLSIYGDKIEEIYELQLVTQKYNLSDVKTIISKKSRIDPWLAHIMTQASSLEMDNRIEQLMSFLDDDPSLYITYHLLGDSYFCAKDYSSAINWYREAVVRKPDYGWSWFNLGRALSENKGEFSERLHVFQHAAELMKGSVHYPDVLNLLAQHLACTRNIRQAINIYIDLHRHESSNDSLLYAIELLLSIGDIKGASSLAPMLEGWPNLYHHIWAPKFLYWSKLLKMSEFD
jgi:tetratricopeptide (TPR) repeat protein